MAQTKTIYKSAESKAAVLGLYDKKLGSLNFPVQEQDVETSYGITRIISTGNKNGKQVVLFHGVHAGAALTLESIEDLRENYHLLCIETIGQATKSADTILNIKDDSFAKWADEVLEKLSIQKADFVGISYGAYILQKLITYKPERVNKCVFVVPSGLANGDFWPSITKLSIPLFRYHRTKKDEDLRKFLEPFVQKDDQYMFEFQKAILNGLHMDYRRPTLLRAKDVDHFTNPVYMIVADDDVFFPADKSIKRAKQVFKNLKEVHTLKNCKHMPHESDLDEIQQKLAEWIG